MFLVDTGAAYSVFSHKFADAAAGPQLTSAGGKLFNAGGNVKTDPLFHVLQFSWTFLPADVQLAIMGADFWKHFQMVVDLATGRLLDTRTRQTF